MRKTLLLLLLVSMVLTVHSQTTRKIKELEKQRKELKHRITLSETLLQSTKKNVLTQLNNLSLLAAQIDQRKKYIETIDKDLKTINDEIFLLEKELAKLRKELGQKKKNYEESVKYMYRNKSIQEKLMFIFSAQTLSQMYRRMIYVRKYADYQKQLGTQLNRKQEQVDEKRSTLVSTREVKAQLLAQVNEERRKLEIQENEHQKLVGQLKTKQRTIQRELNQQRSKAEQLNQQIDRLIQIEIEKARQRAEAERKRKEAEARKLAEAQRKAEEEKKSAEKQTTTDKKKSVATTTTKERKETRKIEKQEVYRVDNEDVRLSANFARNQGLLPVPVTGPYAIIGHYGQYQVSGLNNVRLDNKGIDIKAQTGAQARAIFDGEVSAVFQYNGLSNILVRHGNYISVYCNLSGVNISQGSKVSTRQSLGTIHTDKDGNTVLHFQLRKETSKLNPEAWIRK